jgi:hypothetical protein
MKSLDAYLPSYEFVERHRVGIRDPGQADRALREVTFREVPGVRVLLFLRGLGRRGLDETVVGAMVRRTRVLEDVPGEGIVLELRGRFWRLRGGGDGPEATAVMDFRAELGALTTETRVHVGNAEARRKFACYWRAIRPFSGLIRILVLRAAKRRAEGAA